MFNFEFSTMLQVIKNNRSWIYLSLIIFFGSFLFMAFIDIDSSKVLTELNEESLASLEALLKIIQEAHPLVVASFIFINNVVSSFLMLFLGVILGIVPLFSLFINGALLGTISSQFAQEGFSPWFIVLGILPHGIPELFAFFICSALGLKLGFHVVVPIEEMTRFQSFKFIWKEIFSVLPLVVVLLFVAALLEIFVTKELLLLLFDS